MKDQTNKTQLMAAIAFGLLAVLSFSIFWGNDYSTNASETKVEVVTSWEYSTLTFQRAFRSEGSKVVKTAVVSHATKSGMTSRTFEGTGDGLSSFAQAEQNALSAAMYELGRDGWELTVQSSPYTPSTDTIAYVFKRPIR